MHGDFADMQDTQVKITQLQTNLQLLKQRVDERKKLLLETLAYYKNNRRVSDGLCFEMYAMIGLCAWKFINTDCNLIPWENNLATPSPTPQKQKLDAAWPSG